MFSVRNNVSHLLRTASPGSSSLPHHFRIPSSICSFQPPQPSLRRTYLLLSTTLNPKNPPQLPTSLPAPPKTIILLTSPDSASSLTTSTLSPLTNDSTAALLSAAVDSLPGSKGGNGSRVNGHSWLITDHTLPIRVPSVEPKSLTFSLPTTSFTLSLANTVFQNGQTSTLVHLPATVRPTVIEAAVNVEDPEVEEFAHAQQDIQEAWEELGDLMKIVGVKSGLFPHNPVPVDSVEINISEDVLRDGNGSGRIYTRLPLRRLTKPRKVQEAMGNILRALEMPEGTPHGASRELEAGVDKYIQSLPDNVGAPERVDVFARLTTQAPSSPNPSELLLSPGTRLHRVLSGGGGWGNKAGLLSLDPQGERDVQVFEQEFEARYDGTDAAHGGIVKTGEWVQFYVAENAAPAERGIQFGAVGKMEDTRLVEDDIGGMERTIAGCFGGASEMGVDIGVAGKSRRMDVPGGAVVVDA